MINRDDLTKLRDVGKAFAFIRSIANNRTNITDRAWYCRKGAIKDFVEEYCPLFIWMLDAHPDASAALTEASTPGPDAIVICSDSSKVRIQITVSDQSHQASLQRAQLAAGRLAFPNQRAEKIKNQIISKGRVLTTPNSVIFSSKERILDAIRNKNKRFYEGTKVLLVYMGSPGRRPDREQIVREVSVTLEAWEIPYDEVYVVTSEFAAQVFPPDA